MAAKLVLPGVGLITGAASGIGRTTALAFASAGCKSLALVDLNESGLEETRRLVNNLLDSAGSAANIQTYKVDVTSPNSVSDAYASVKEKFGRLDYSVHAAGIVSFDGSSTTTPVESFDRLNNVLYRGVWLCSKEALKIMRSQSLDSEAFPSESVHPLRAQRGSIVNVSSALGLLSQANSPVYCAAKAALLGLTRSDAIDHALDRIRVNAILPGLVDSPMGDTPQEIVDLIHNHVIPRTPLKREALREEIADTIVYLASNKASYVTGASWAVDGGLTAGY
ncbi:hypothetical protein LTR93_011339 [Exophiala xenobiotica]|nr:hypothetical protein LTR93_011339 [Exophiala xenobiotica]